MFFFCFLLTPFKGDVGHWVPQRVQKYLDRARAWKESKTEIRYAVVVIPIAQKQSIERSWKYNIDPTVCFTLAKNEFLGQIYDDQYQKTEQ